MSLSPDKDNENFHFWKLNYNIFICALIFSSSIHVFPIEMEKSIQEWK